MRHVHEQISSMMSQLAAGRQAASILQPKEPWPDCSKNLSHASYARVCTDVTIIGAVPETEDCWESSLSAHADCIALGQEPKASATNA